MKPKKSAPGEMSAATSRPARTPEAQENYMINLAMKLVEKRLLEGTASSAETTHFLKLATSKNELEKTKLKRKTSCCGQRPRHYRMQSAMRRCMGRSLLL